MITAFHLSGYWAAHAVWSVSDGETLVPMFACKADDDIKMMRLVTETFEEAVEYGKTLLDSNETDADDAALLYDGYIDVGSEKLDAILIEIRSYFSPDSRAVLAIPYTPKSNSSEFRVHKPKVFDWQNCDDFEMDAVLESFFEGVYSHEEGAKIWNESLDESK